MAKRAEIYWKGEKCLSECYSFLHLCQEKFWQGADLIHPPQRGPSGGLASFRGDFPRGLVPKGFAGTRSLVPFTLAIHPVEADI